MLAPMKVVHDIEPIAVTVPGAARALGVGTTKIKDEIAAGRIAVARIGKRVVVPVSSLTAYLRELAA